MSLQERYTEFLRKKWMIETLRTLNQEIRDLERHGRVLGIDFAVQLYSNGWSITHLTF